MTMEDEVKTQSFCSVCGQPFKYPFNGGCTLGYCSTNKSTGRRMNLLGRTKGGLGIRVDDGMFGLLKKVAETK